MLNLPSEKKVSDFWDKANIFKKSLEKDSPKGDYVFYDGPPFATGMPHYGHIVASVIKDAIPRYRTMTGYRVERKWGWDCHGLPIENIVEKKLGSRKKKDVEKIGVQKFNELCRSKVLDYIEGWKTIIKRLGRWVDIENSYKTMDLNFMESVWWVFKQLWDRGLIYESYRAMYICPRCETTLSQTEVSEGYKIVKDLAVVVKFKLEPNQKCGNFVTDKNTYILAWTTTPWTLIGNVALAVGKNIKYALIDMDKQAKELKGKYIIAADRMCILEQNVEKKHPAKLFKIDSVILGKDLLGTRYKPSFDYYLNDEKLKNRENGWKIYHGDFVTTESGTGIVHIAPAFGQDDMNFGRQYKLPFIQHVNMDGTIKKEAKDFAGMNVKPIDNYQKTNIEIIKYLTHKGLLFHKENFEHSYPHCWRCDTPLINYVTSSWFVNILKIKDKIVKSAKNIYWFPEHIKNGRFGKWLAGAHDWSISRQRFWASVMPIWKCHCDQMKIFGSIAELEKASGQKINDLHKHTLDKIKFPCTKCGGQMERIPDVLDAWFDSGSMPYAYRHYPFENKSKFDHNFPAEFIAEGIDQTRCWFYYLHVIGVAIKNSCAFKNAIVSGIVLAEDGKKMSKKLKNYPDPSLIIDKYGADSLRLYLLSSPVVNGENLNFSEKRVEKVLRNNLAILWNVFKFYELFKDGQDIDFELISFQDVWQKTNNILDKWILISLNKLIVEATEAMENYNLPAAIKPITNFINDLSLWYLRRSRNRFKSKDGREKKVALMTTSFVLREISKIIAPFTPFIAEQIWQKITGNDFKNNQKSVHLEAWPESINLSEFSYAEGLDILKKMELVRKIIKLGLKKRQDKKIKIRQPLKKLIIKNPVNMLEQLNNDYLGLIKDELNVKEVEFSVSEGNLDTDLDTDISHELKLEGLAREIMRTVNSLRKEAGLSITDSAQLYYSDNNKLSVVFDKFGQDILQKVLCTGYKGYKTGDMRQIKFKKEFVFDEEKFLIGIKKN